MIFYCAASERENERERESEKEKMEMGGGREKGREEGRGRERKAEKPSSPVHLAPALIWQAKMKAASTQLLGGA